MPDFTTLFFPAMIIAGMVFYEAVVRPHQSTKHAAVRAEATLHLLCQELAAFTRTRMGLICFGEDRRQLDYILAQFFENCLDGDSSATELQKLNEIVDDIMSQNSEEQPVADSELYVACKLFCKENMIRTLSDDREILAIESQMDAYLGSAYFPFTYEIKTQADAKMYRMLHDQMLDYFRQQVKTHCELRSHDNQDKAETTYKNCIVALRCVGSLCHGISLAWRHVRSVQRKSMFERFFPSKNKTRAIP